MSFFCRIGLHRWSFSSEFVDKPGQQTHSEVVRARCRRRGCTRYGAWSLVHREPTVPETPAPDSPLEIA